MKRLNIWYRKFKLLMRRWRLIVSQRGGQWLRLDWRLATRQGRLARLGLARPYPWEPTYPLGVSWDFDEPAQTLPELLDRAVEQFSDRPCLQFYGRKYTYAQTGDLVARAAKGFQALGVGPGVKVGLLLPNSHYYVICYFAVLKAGGTVVNYNPLYAEQEVARQIRDSGTKVMVTMNLNMLYQKVSDRLDDSDVETVVVCRMSSAFQFPANAFFAIVKRKEIADIPSDDRHLRFEKLVANDSDPQPVDIDPENDVAVMQYTGGKIGVAMGAMLTHAGLFRNAKQMRLWAPDVKLGQECVLAVLPLTHVFGMTGVMNYGLTIGAEIALLPRFKTGEVLKLIEQKHPSILFAVPTMFAMFNSHPDLADQDLSSLRYCISGGAALPGDIKSDFEKVTGCRIVEGYGLSETGPVCTVNPFDGRDRDGSVGLPVPGTVIKVVSLTNPKKPVPPGKRGEVCVSGPQVMTGYWLRQDETATVFEDGYLRTGDIGYLDRDGFLYLTGRLKNLVISGGFNVYPRMVEEAILQHPSVKAVAVCGIPDQQRGENVKAYVTLRSGEKLTARALRLFLRDKIAPYEMPRKVEFVDVFPDGLIGSEAADDLSHWNAQAAE